MSSPRPAATGSTRLIAVGVGLGLRSDGNEVVGVVRRGGICHTMDENLYAVWRHALPSVTEEELRRVGDDAAPAPGPSVEWGIDWLLTHGLLVPVADEAEAALPMLERHRMIPLGIGLGNSTETAGAFAIGDRDLQPLVSVDALTYGVWCASDQQRSLVECCRLVAEETAMTPSAVSSAVLQRLPGLLAAIVAWLDAVDEPRRSHSRSARLPEVIAS